MCDPVTIAGIAATVGSTVVNTMAANKAAKARDGVLAAERIRQNQFDQEAAALNETSRERFGEFETKRESKAQDLGDYFAAPPPDTLNQSAGAAMPSASNDVVTREITKKSGEAKAFTDQQAGALGELRAFGDLLGDTSRMQGRDASLVGQIGGFKRGSSNVTPLELDEASRKGDKLKVFGDILGGVGSIATGYGLTRGAGAAAGSAGGASLAPARSPIPIARPASLYGNQFQGIY